MQYRSNNDFRSGISRPNRRHVFASL